jgi:hypothetical protein
MAPLDAGAIMDPSDQGNGYFRLQSFWTQTSKPRMSHYLEQSTEDAPCSISALTVAGPHIIQIHEEF